MVSILTIQMPDEWKNKEKIIQLTDITGRILLEKRVNTEGVGVSVEDVPNGLYFIKIIIDNQVFVRKIVIAK
jgi:Secretion system C-terminal sorting domain